MFRQLRILRLFCVLSCLLVALPAHAFADDGQPTIAPAHAPARIRDTIRQMSFAAAADKERGRQSVATTNESKLLLGLVTGGLIVGGAAMLAFGSTATCKGTVGESTQRCDRMALVGTMSFVGGMATALLWALSR